VAQCTPGIIAVSTAAFVGKRVKGNLGGISAVLGVCIPSMVMITAAAALLSGFMDIPAVAYALGGVRACVCALIVNAIAKLFKSSVIDIKTLVLFALALAAALIWRPSPLIFIAAAVPAGILLKRKGKRGEGEE
jgi:chromate transporter